MHEPLGDPCLALQPSDICRNLLDVFRCHPLDFRHVAELPMVSANTVFDGTLECRVAMMAGLIDLMHKGRALSSTGPAYSMAASTVRIEFGLTLLKLSRNRRRGLYLLCGLLLAACRHEQQKTEQPDLRQPSVRFYLVSQVHV